MQAYDFLFTSPEQTAEFARDFYALAQKISEQKSVNIYLLGNLGAGKSTFSRAFIQAAGYQGNIPSPTYSIQEDYAVGEHTIYHLDLYRLGDVGELEVLGFFDNQQPNTIFLIEWPQILMHDYPPMFLATWDYVEQEPNARKLYLQFVSSQLPASLKAQAEAKFQALSQKYTQN
ncbi:tRNA (adenosine(37)-N6)-threonylcarbamoyltransferase complex ATPase subunit type 1 TsaE [Psittacicella hinzii]|uniref:tRNA threonylcarbamoyladenosine biosynthesis protein TsaE n=1 Tax=Psittacicella hinzii TaxID=2028575 RepID=A0A3A1YPM8_9GAMM|nr:tRNA (adenosine(37)-N6)-threonylcarbamoyltransferase complex ATPase subunit type 1 TsaE [Psittacicella hinzii]RIY39456.1 tRNA (adenosine(37)-N6)-threonylcarbamoyltransferase complex ATPase subunit type 1 TsaE [Psittacicella hinzii]